MERILILAAASRYADLADMVESAVKRADLSRRLTFGLVLEQEPDEEESARMGQAPGARFILDSCAPRYAFPIFWQGEGNVLLGHPDMRFTRGWDRQLTHIHAVLP